MLDQNTWPISFDHENVGGITVIVEIESRADTMCCDTERKPYACIQTIAQREEKWGKFQIFTVGLCALYLTRCIIISSAYDRQLGQVYIHRQHHVLKCAN